jgi:hypothetical protein
MEENTPPRISVISVLREYTILYNPQQNGVAERKNITIIEASKEMIHDQSLPMILWAEASMTTIYIQNMSPHQILKNMTPEEAFTVVNPEVGHFRIFGCPIYFHISKEKRSKLDPSGRKGTFVGYNESSKAYRIYIPGQRQIKVSKDLIFEEEITFRRSKESWMKIDNETIPSPPSTIQREATMVPVDLVAPVDVLRDITVGHKRSSWDR